jgi:hypothetical protein
MTRQAPQIQLVMFTLAGFFGCDGGQIAQRTSPKADEKREAAEVARQEDQSFEQLVAGKDEDGDRVMEARQYLAPDQPQNGMWKTSREQTLQWAEELYKAGAPTVYAVYSPADETIKVNMCSSLLIKLPTEKTQRAALLTAFHQIDEQLWGEDADDPADVGQKYLYLNMDP